MTQYWRHLNKQIRHKHKSKHSGQSIVEFALISIILFSLILGIIEMGRFMFIFTQVTAAAEEGARFGSENPIQVIQQQDAGLGGYPVSLQVPNPPAPGADCNIVTRGWQRLVLIPWGGHWDDPANGGANDGVDITVDFDGGDENTTCSCKPFPNDTTTPVDFSVGSDRVVVTAIYHFHFLTGILDRFVPATGLPVQMTAARTILRSQASQPTNPQCETPP